MIVRITNSFKNNFQKEFKNYHFNFFEFIKTLKNKNYISLQTPFAKVKLKFYNKSMRGIIVIIRQNMIMPLFFVEKSNKQRGNNLILDEKVLKKIDILMGKFEKDLIEKNFEDF